MDITPRDPRRPLFWDDPVLDLQHTLADVATPLYIVGGAVRDAYLHRPIKDIDLATPGDSIALARKIANRLKGDIFVLDDERGVGRVLLNTASGRLTLDVVRFRGDDLLADLLDRDFTINAMAVDVHANLNQLIDPLNAEQDLLDKRMRRCSSHAIADDPIRALRAVRQSVQLKFQIDSQTLNDIRTAVPRLNESSPERLRDEFVTMVALPNPSAALRVAERLGLLDNLLPPVVRLREAQYGSINGWQRALTVVESLTNLVQAISPARTEYSTAVFGLGMMVIQLDRYRARLNSHLMATWANERPHRALLVLAALLREMPEAVESCADGLRLSNAEKQRLTAIVSSYEQPAKIAPGDARAIHRFWHQLGEAGVDACLLAAADYLGTNGSTLDHKVWLGLVEQIQTLLHANFEQYDQLVRPPVLIDGSQLMEQLALQPGRVVGELLNLIREEQAAGEIRSVEDALRIAREHLNHKNGT